MVKKAVKNIVLILLLDLIALPAGIFLYLVHGFHIVHVVLGMGYLFGIVMVYDTAVILMKHVRIVNDPETAQAIEETFYEEGEEPAYDDMHDVADFTEEQDLELEEIDEPIKPEMKAAMDQVFNLKRGE